MTIYLKKNTTFFKWWPKFLNKRLYNCIKRYYTIVYVLQLLKQYNCLNNTQFPSCPTLISQHFACHTLNTLLKSHPHITHTNKIYVCKNILNLSDAALTSADRSNSTTLPLTVARPIQVVCLRSTSHSLAPSARSLSGAAAAPASALLALHASVPASPPAWLLA